MEMNEYEQFDIKLSAVLNDVEYGFSFKWKI